MTLKYSLLLISIIIFVEVTRYGEATDRPSYHAVGKEDIVAVDRKTFRSDVWEHFGWHRKAIGSSWVVCNRCCAWVSRKGNNTSNMRHHLKSVHGVVGVTESSIM